MRINRKVVYDMNDWRLLERVSEDYQGPLALCGGTVFATVPLSIPGSPFGSVIYNDPLAPITASLSTTTLLNAPSTGTYRLSIYGETTVLGSGATTTLGHHTVALTYTDPSAYGTGYVNTSTTAVTWVSGAQFNPQWTGSITINGTSYTISSVTNATALVLTATAGTQTNVVYSWSAAAQTVAAFATLTLGTGSNFNGVLGTAPLTGGTSFVIFRALAGTAIQLATTLTAAGGSPAPEPNLVLYPTIEILGQ